MGIISAADDIATKEMGKLIVGGHMIWNFLGQSEGGLKKFGNFDPFPKLNLMRTGRGTECKKSCAFNY